jgi:hypothetical protein
VISKKFDSAQRENHHPQQHQSVSPSRNVGLAAGSFGIADGNVDQFEIQLCGTEEQIEITERMSMDSRHAVVSASI